VEKTEAKKQPPKATAATEPVKVDLNTPKLKEAIRRQGIYLSSGTPVPQSSLDWLGQTSVQNSKDTSRRVPPGVWHDVLEAEESVIVSDRYERTIFLVRFPEAKTVLHEEERERDMTDFFAEREKGLGWKR
jgi:hypothetical protein